MLTVRSTVDEMSCDEVHILPHGKLNGDIFSRLFFLNILLTEPVSKEKFNYRGILNLTVICVFAIQA